MVLEFPTRTVSNNLSLGNARYAESIILAWFGNSKKQGKII